MRFPSIALVLVTLCTPSLAQTAPDSSGVTILRGASAPPAPPPPAAPQTTVVYRETVYTPVYTNPPAYLVAIPQSGFRHSDRMAPVPSPSAVPNGWPLLQTPGRR